MFWQITYVGYTLVQYSSLTTFCIFHYSSSCFSADMLYILQVNHNISEAKEVFVEGIKQAPCKALIKGFMQFMSTHGGPTEIPILDSVISNAVVPGSDISTVLSREDREDISLLFLEVREF
jgi:pre-mRNA-processing factor 39